MNRPNLFAFATSELSQDAFISWLLAWADPHYRATNEALHKTATTLLDSLLDLAQIHKPAKYEAVEVIKPFQKIDILGLINNDIALVIEDKTFTADHSGQLHRYRKMVYEKWPGRKIGAIYLKTGDQSNFQTVEEAGYVCFLRKHLLEILEHGEQLGVKNDIYLDFLGHLRKVEHLVRSYQQVPVQDWGREHLRWIELLRWTGFFTALQERLGHGEWKYVPNPSGGVMCFNWHLHTDQFPQLEEEKLCFQIKVEDKGHQEAKWNEWQNALMAESQNSDLTLQRPSRRAKGPWMTVAVLEGDYRQTDRDGYLDLDQTVAVLKKAELLLDSAFAKAQELRPGKT